MLLFDASTAGIRYDPMASHDPRQLCKFDLTGNDIENGTKLVNLYTLSNCELHVNYLLHLVSKPQQTHQFVLVDLE